MRLYIFILVFVVGAVAGGVAGYYLSLAFINMYNSGGGVSLNRDIMEIKFWFIIVFVIIGAWGSVWFADRFDRHYLK